MGSCFLRLLSTSPPFPSSAPGYLCFSFFFTFMNSKEIQPVHPKENQPWILFGKTDAEAETPVLWPPDAKSWLIGKERLKAREEGDSRGWDGCMVSPTQWTWVWANSGRSWGQGSLVCCSPWGCKESDMTGLLNNNNKAEISTGSLTLSFLFLFGKLISKSSCLVF